MIRVLPAIVEFALLVFCLIDCFQTDRYRVRNLSKGLWIVLIVLFPLIGGIAWLVAGRPERTERRAGVWYSESTGFPEHERPDSLARHRSDHGTIDDRVAREQARVDAEYEEDVTRARSRATRIDPPAPG